MRRAPSAPLGIALGVAIFLALAGNQAFWKGLLRVVPPDSPANLVFLASTFLVLVAALNLVLLPFSFRATLKPASIAALLLAAACAHFMDGLGIVIDRDVVQSVVETDPQEVRDLLGPGLLFSLLGLGLLPALVVARIPLRPEPLGRALAQRAGVVLGSLGLAAVLVVPQFKAFALVGREHAGLRQLVNPAAPLAAALRYASGRRGAQGLERIGQDARLSDVALHRERRSLVILVVGETARAANFSLNGYARQTNPRLATLPVVDFTQVQACGTATAVSLPCIFSAGGRRAFSSGRASNRENLLDVLQRAGVAVRWRDNNSGCKGVCARVPTEGRKQLGAPELCDAEGCYDEVLLQGLQGVIDGLHGDGLIVLHQQGSHGPLYQKRSPSALKRFLPECEDADIQECPHESIVNGYDNSILYTDLVLSRAIELLEANRERFDTALLYVSDHGESLGENGIYLHGLPRILAPDEQTHVPMILWLSDSMVAAHGIDRACLERSRHEPRSHDVLFPSLLGLFDVSTALYAPELDVFAACRGEGASPGGAELARDAPAGASALRYIQ